MRITVCELPHKSQAAASAWDALAQHVREHHTELLILPEFAFLEPIWQRPNADAQRWTALVNDSESWLQRLPELQCANVIGAMPVSVADKPFNQGFLWTKYHGKTALRSKRYLPNEDGGWEARWFNKGDAQFPMFKAGALNFGLNICTELWALDSYGPYAAAGVHAIVTPRATAAATTERWVARAKTAAVRSGAYSLSSNRRHEDGSCGGVGWIIDPEGNELARTSIAAPFVTIDIDLNFAVVAKSSYPRYVFSDV